MNPKLLPLLQSGVLRGLLVAAVGLLGTVLGLFGVNEALFATKAASVVESLCSFATAAGLVYAAYARITLPTPPITQAAEAKAVARQAALDEQAGRVPQSGFVRPAMLAMMLCLGAVVLPSLQGCQSIGLAKPESVEDRIAYAYGQTTGVLQAATQAHRTEQISDADLAYVIKLTDESVALLDAATIVLTNGDASSAEGRLILVTRVLAQLQVYLNSKGR